MIRKRIKRVETGAVVKREFGRPRACEEELSGFLLAGNRKPIAAASPVLCTTEHSASATISSVRPYNALEGFDLVHSHVFLRIHSSSSNSLAELRFPGSHCNIFCIKRRKIALSCPSRVVSLSSSIIRSCNGIPAQKSPRGSDIVSG
jgi:hypothetical protein